MSVNDSKKYYWVKLKYKFFDDYKMKVLEKMPNGKIYELIYLKLLTESTKHNGNLRFSEMIPYDSYSLSIVINEDKDNVENAIKILQELELVEILDDKTIFMTELNKIVGYETGQTIRKRQANIDKKDDGGKCLVNFTQEYRVKSKEYRDKSKEIRVKNKDNNNNQLIVYNNISCLKEKEFIPYFSKVCPSQPIIKMLNKKRVKAINELVKKYGKEEFDKALRKVEASDFLTGRDGKWKPCGIDWIINPNNFIKILEGNYDNNKKSKSNNLTHIAELSERTDKILNINEMIGAKKR